jgi:hypothetical protein
MPGLRADPIFSDGVEVPRSRHHWSYSVLQLPAGKHSFHPVRCPNCKQPHWDIEAERAAPGAAANEGKARGINPTSPVILNAYLSALEQRTELEGEI